MTNKRPQGRSVLFLLFILLLVVVPKDRRKTGVVVLVFGLVLLAASFLILGIDIFGYLLRKCLRIFGYDVLRGTQDFGDFYKEMSPKLRRGQSRQDVLGS